jgi:protein-S-isoprenylcysteine O-methyltransferase Ste14
MKGPGAIRLIPKVPQGDLTARLAHLRVPIGFLLGVVCLWLAEPSRRSILIGLPVAVLGEAIRIWAAGHLDKGREVTRSGPYRFTGHPLYLGSVLMGVGVAIGAARVPVALLVLAYLVATLSAAMRREERWLQRQFGAEYDAYRNGVGESARRRFSLARLKQNREYRAMIGLAVALALLVLRALV